MPTATLTISEEMKCELKDFPWVNWSEVAREEVLKRLIFDKFLKTGELSDEDQKFCDSMDWYPVDELPLREEYVERLKRLEKLSDGKSMTAKEFDKWCDEL